MQAFNRDIENRIKKILEVYFAGKPLARSAAMSELRSANLYAGYFSEINLELNVSDPELAILMLAITRGKQWIPFEK